MGIHQRSKKPTNVSIDAQVVDEAKQLGINISQAAEEGIRNALRTAWMEENRAAIEANNKWVEENGIPLEEHRMFDV